MQERLDAFTQALEAGTAHELALTAEDVNGLIEEDFPLNAQTLPQLQMPNRKGFVDMSRQ